MRNNPLLAQLLRKTVPPALWLTILFAGAVMVWVTLTMLPGLAQMQAQATPVPEAHASLFFGSLPVLLGTPVMVGVNAAVFTCGHARPDNLKALKLGNVSGPHKAWGYGLAALFRMRMPISLAAGLTPAFALGLTETMLLFYQIARPGCGSSGPCSGMLADPAFNTGYWLATNALVAAGALGISPLAAALGTWAALMWKRAVLASAMAVAGIVVATGTFVALLGPSEGVPLPIALAAAVAPYGLAWAITGAAAGFAARQAEEGKLQKGKAS